MPVGTLVWLAAGVTDMRRGFASLAARGRGGAGARSRCGARLVVFRGRPGDVVKAIWWDGQGSGLFSKRLERGRFVWPAATEGQGGDDAGASRAMLLEGWGGPANGPGRCRPDE